MSKNGVDQLEHYIPLDKSWLMRLGFLDILAGRHGIDEFIQALPDASTDLRALARASRQWREGSDIEVGESGTLYRFLQFAAWLRDEDRVFVKTGTLRDREMIDDPSIVNLPLAELLLLDGGTSQWASAAVLLGNDETPPDPLPYKLGLTYEAKNHWQRAVAVNERWTARPDKTIAAQARAYLIWRKTGVMRFSAEQAEDYCFARAFNLIGPEEGEARWPSLRQHESDRIAEMEEVLGQDIVGSVDHRVVQAAAMLKGEAVTIAHPDAVSKSWPEFWQFMEVAHKISS